MVGSGFVAYKDDKKAVATGGRDTGVMCQIPVPTKYLYAADDVYQMVK